MRVRVRVRARVPTTCRFITGGSFLIRTGSRLPVPTGCVLPVASGSLLPVGQQAGLAWRRIGNENPVTVGRVAALLPELALPDHQPGLYQRSYVRPCLALANGGLRGDHAHSGPQVAAVLGLIGQRNEYQLAPRWAYLGLEGPVQCCR